MLFENKKIKLQMLLKMSTKFLDVYFSLNEFLSQFLKLQNLNPKFGFHM
jgi:hypothetical protein